MSLTPQEALLAGCLLLTVAAGWVPLVARFYSGSGFGAKAVAMVAAAGVLVIMLRPPLPIEVGAPYVNPRLCFQRGLTSGIAHVCFSSRHADGKG